MHRIPAVAFAILIATDSAFATDRFFGDKTVVSPSGQFRLEAKSPDNAGEGRHAFAAHFVYSLTEVATGKVLWTHEQPMKKDGDYEFPDGEGSPSGVFLDDDGRAVVFTGHQELFVLDPKSGKKVFQAELLKEFTEEENNRYVQRTTAGPRWAGMGRWTFLTVKSGDMSTGYFVIRPYWGRRLFLDLTKLVLVGEEKEEKPVVDAAVKADRDWVVGVLSKVGDLPQCGEGDCAPRHEAEKAAWMAGVLGVKEAVEPLRRMEADDYSGSSSMSDFSWSTLQTRQIVHLSLRRLGEVPRKGPLLVITSYTDSESDSEQSLEIPKDAPGIAERAAKAGEVKAGIKVTEMLKLVGEPDYRGPGRNTFDYDMDATPPFTLRVTLSANGGTVSGVQRLDPPVWKDSLERDTEIAH